MSKKVKKMPKKDGKLTTKSPVGVRPLADRVLVQPLGELESGTTTKGGNYIPETVDKEKPQEGIVVAVGPGRYEDGKIVPMGVKVGNKVVFSKYGPDEIKVDGKEYFIISESNILAVIE